MHNILKSLLAIRKQMCYRTDIKKKCPESNQGTFLKERIVTFSI